MNVRQLHAIALSIAGACAAGSAAAATNVATLPLKASVLAKPNVVFSMDDSGSMDAEVMIDGHFQGWFYGNYNNATLYPGGVPRTGSASYDWNMFYLFPNGTGTGNKVYGDPNQQYGYAIPPTPELAWVRSAAYNTIYYDSTKTYVPWSPAYVNSALSSFGNATTTSAKSHPTLGSTTMSLTSNVTNTGSDWRFTFTAGMTIPSGASNVSCLWGTTPGSPLGSAYTVPTSNGMCKASMSYYPATFWQRESCTVDGTTCVTNWDGQTLKRYEIKSGNSFPSGRSYAAEIQNFANWFQYYRKRRLMLANAMGNVLEDINGLRLGVVAFNANASPTMYDADSTVPASNRLAVSGIFYNNEGGGGTPTNTTMSYVRGEFDTNTNVIQYACQRNASFIITDGFSNDSFVAPPAYNAATYGSGSPYQTTSASSLADKALAYFTLRLRASGGSSLPAGKVPSGDPLATNPDTNTDLHLTTYALTLGMKGTIFPSATDPFVVAPTWPAPASNTATMIDDLWHATINGRGEMYLATDVDATAQAIRQGLTAILSQTGAQGGVAVSTVNLVRGDNRAYFGTYNPAGWVGDVTAHPIDPATGVIDASTELWSASSLLTARSWATRVIASSNGSSGVGFTAAAVGGLVNPGNVWGTTTDVIDYLRGNRTLEGSTFRRRSALLGGVVNSEPAVDRANKVVYVQSGEGMLHAIDTDPATAGTELWAFVPYSVLGNIGATVDRAYAFKTQLDGSPTLGTYGTNQTLLVAGTGAAGRSFHALDVTSPRSLNEAGVAAAYKWQFPAAGDATTQAKVGQALGRARIVKTSSDGYVVLVTSGHNPTGDGKGRMWMLNASTGAVIQEFTTAVSGESGLAQVDGYVENDGTVRYVYGGDLLGNVWRFDLVGKGAPQLLAVLKDGSSNLQPVTATPALTEIDGKRIVIVGTGRLLDITDFGSSRVQTLYAIADGSTLSNARSGLVQQVYTRGATPEVTANAVDWASTRGWYMDLPAGEQANTQPAVAYGAVAFTSNTNGGSDCTASSYLYVLDLLSGSTFPGAAFVSTSISTTANSSGVTALATTGNGIVGSGQDNDGNPWREPLVTTNVITPAKNAWREIRRR